MNARARDIGQRGPDNRRRDSDRLFAAALAASLLLNGAALAFVSQRSNPEPDLDDLVIVDVQRSRTETRRIALAPDAPKPPPPTPAAPAPRPPALRVRKPPAPTPAPAPAPVPTPRTPRKPDRRPVEKPAAPAASAPPRNAGSRLATGATSERGTAQVIGEGHTAPGTSGAGIGGAEGVGTGAGRGRGADVPVAAPHGDAPAPPPVAPPVRPAPPPPSPPSPPPPPPKPEPPAPPPPPKPEPPPPPPPAPKPPAPKVRTGASVKTRVEPDYPARARNSRQQGVVQVLVTVGTDGRAQDVRVRASSGHESLDAAALAAVRRWSFEPARVDGQPVASQIVVPIRFRLRD